MASRRFPIGRVSSSGIQQTDDSIAIEEPLQIVVNARKLSITMRTPGADEELAIGFLFTEGLISEPHSIRSVSSSGNEVHIELNTPVAAREERNFAVTSACGVCGKSSVDAIFNTPSVRMGDLTIESELLRALPAKLRLSQCVFEQTGGIHAAGLFDSAGDLRIVREDVGRHNAVDKVIGCMVQSNALSPNGVLLVSGRASFELVQKAAMAGIPILAAVGAPSTLAIETAKRFGMALAGFVSTERFNLYTGAGRVQSALTLQ